MSVRGLWGSRSGSDAGWLHPCLRRSPSRDAALGAPGLGSRGRAWPRAQAEAGEERGAGGGGSQFPSRGLRARWPGTQPSGSSSGMPRRAEAARSPAGGGAAGAPGPQFPMRGPLHARGSPGPAQKGGQLTGKALGPAARRAGAEAGGGARRRGASRAAAPARSRASLTFPLTDFDLMCHRR